MSNKFSQLKFQNLLDRDPDKFEPRPRMAWAAIFFSEIILIVLVLAAHLFLYDYVRTDTSYKSSNESVRVNEAKLNRKGLSEITAMFEKKNVQFQDLMASSPKIADPSETAPATPANPDLGTVSQTATGTATVL